MSENDIYCETRKQTLIREIIADSTDTPDTYQDFSLKQLEQFKARIPNKQSPTIVQQTRSTLDNKNLTVGNSLLGKRFGET